MCFQPVSFGDLQYFSNSTLLTIFFQNLYMVYNSGSRSSGVARNKRGGKYLMSLCELQSICLRQRSSASLSLTVVAIFKKVLFKRILTAISNHNLSISTAKNKFNLSLLLELNYSSQEMSQENVSNLKSCLKKWAKKKTIALFSLAISLQFYRILYKSWKSLTSETKL